MSAPSSDRAGIRQTIRALKAAGWHLDCVDNGGEEGGEKVSTETEALDEIMAVDDAYLIVRDQPIIGQTAWVRFVMGNDPEEVICDHTINLSTVLDPLTQGWNS